MLPAIKHRPDNFKVLKPLEDDIKKRLPPIETGSKPTVYTIRRSTGEIRKMNGYRTGADDNSVNVQPHEELSADGDDQSMDCDDMEQAENVIHVNIESDQTVTETVIYQ